MTRSALLVSPETALQDYLENRGFQVHGVPTLSDAAQVLEQTPPDVLVMDIAPPRQRHRVH